MDQEIKSSEIFALLFEFNVCLIYMRIGPNLQVLPESMAVLMIKMQTRFQDKLIHSAMTTRKFSGGSKGGSGGSLEPPPCPLFSDIL